MKGTTMKLFIFLLVHLSILIGQAELRQYLEFDGSDDYIEVPYSSSFNDFTDALSFTAWVKVSGGSGTHRNIITNGVQGGGFVITADDQNKFRPHIQQQLGWLQFQGNTTIQNDIWYHLVVTYDS